MQIDPQKPVRFADGNHRVRIVGHARGCLTVRFHDDAWKTSRFTEHGDHVRLAGSRNKCPRLENYAINFDRPLAFQDTGERGHLTYFPGTEDFYGVTDSGGELYWFTNTGMPVLRRGGFEIAGRHIMNVETVHTRRADAARRVIQHKIGRDAAERNPLWGMF